MRFTLFVLLSFCCLSHAEGRGYAQPIRIDARLLRPTQIAAGYEEMSARRQKILQFNPAEYERYLQKKVTKVILGPQKSVWIVDGHHLALIVISIGRNEVWARIIEDWSSLNWETFFQMMARNHALWLYDENGRPSDIQHLPTRLEEMRNDPFRSLAWKVQNEGGYSSTDIFFADFMWANYFRQWISLDDLLERPKVALRKALFLSRDPMAQGLPGAIGHFN